MSWEVKFHMADEDDASAPYDELLVTTVAALSGYDTTTWNTYTVNEQVNPDGEPVDFANGSLQQACAVRFSYSLRMVSESFATGRDLITTRLKQLLEAKHLWAEFRTAAQDSAHNVGVTDVEYHSANYCIPVTITSTEPGHDETNGLKTLTIALQRKFRPQ